MKKSQRTTLYKNNSGLIVKIKVNRYKKVLCLTEKLVSKSPLLFLYETVGNKLKKTEKTENEQRKME